MWCNLKKIKRLFFLITSFFFLLLGVLFANNFAFLFSRFFNPFSEATGSANSYAESQKKNAGKSVYEIWWKGFNAGGYQENTICGEQPWLNCKFGNAQGIIDKLDYVKSLNVDYLWITPFFQSPQLDNGYDIADYYNVDSLFGINADFQQLLKRAHEKDLKILIDLVMNHTSRENPWFLWASGHSVSSSPFWKKEMYAKFIKNNNKPQGGDFEFPQFDEIPKKEIQNYYQDYYWFWKKEIKDIKKFDEEIKGKKQSEVYPPFFHDNGLNDNVHNGKKINMYNENLNYKNFINSNIRNFSWYNNFNTFPYSLVNSYKPFNKETNPYYLHTFSDFQPDLNWNNPNVRKEMKKIANFYIQGKNWLKGEKVDGFRFDAVTLISKFGWKNDKDNKYLGYYDPHNELLVPSLNLDKYLGNFKNATYGPPNLFTVGELSQASADDKQATTKNTKVAREMFTTAYLPLDTLWNFKYSGDGSLSPVLKSWDEHTKTPMGKLDFGVFFNEFLKDSFKQNSILNNNSALIAENHDQPRSVTRFGRIADGTDKTYFKEVNKEFPKIAKNAWKYWAFSPHDINNTDFENKVFPRAKALAAFKFLQPGISFIYAGQEYSHDNYPFYYEDLKKEFLNSFFLDSIDLQAKSSLLNWRIFFRNNKGEIFTPPWLKGKKDVFKKVFHANQALTGRDSARTPFQWSGKNNAGWREDFEFWNGFKDPRSKVNNDIDINKDVPYFKRGVFFIQNDLFKPNNFSHVRLVRGKLSKRKMKKFYNIKKIITKDGKNKFLMKKSILADAYLILNPHYTKINVSSQEHDSNSPLNYYRQLLKLHNDSQWKSFFRKGKFTPLKEGKDFKVITDDGKPLVAAYKITYHNKKLLVAVELGNKKEIVQFFNERMNPEREILSLGFNKSYLNGNNKIMEFNGAAAGAWLSVIDYDYDLVNYLLLIMNGLISIMILILSFKKYKKRK